MRRALPLLAMTVIVTSHAASAWAVDRYGAPPANEPDQAAPLPMLNWPGKATSAPLADVAAPAQPAPTLAKPSQAAPARTTPTSLYDTPPPRWRTSNEAPAQAPPPAPAPIKAADRGQPPHFYSLARQYGVQPDPMQLSPQFLAATPQADMAEPPPLPPPHTAGAQAANMSTAAATNQVRQAQEAAADADSAALGN